MAFSLHRKKGSPFWYAFFRVPDPDRPGEWKQISKSTRETKKADSEARARELEAAALAEAGAGNEKSQEIYAILKRAADEAVRSNLNEARARLFLSEMLKASTGSGLVVYSVREWFNGWLADKEKANSQGTYIRYKGVVKQFLNFLPETRSEGNVMNLTAEDIRDFRDIEKASGKSAGTVNDAVKTIRTALNKAKRSQVILWNPAEAVEMLVEEEVEKEVFSPSALTKLLNVADESWRGVILAGFYTGANLRDITNLRWSQIDLVKMTLEYRRKKTGNAIVLPLHEELSEWLLSQPSRKDPKAFVFPELAGKATSGKSGLSMKFSRLMKKAGLKGVATEPAKPETGKKSKGRTRNSLTFHSLRHSFNSAMANAGVPIEVRSKLTGHSSARTNEGYTHLELETYRAAISKVSRTA